MPVACRCTSLSEAFATVLAMMATLPLFPGSSSNSSSPQDGVTFLHTADWQLGMVRHFLGPEAQARYDQARIDAIERIVDLAAESGAAFVVVAGDVFDANQVDRQVVLRACEAMRSLPCPAYLLPGNHDCLEPGSVWVSRTLTEALPEQVEVLSDSQPRTPVEGVQVVGFPWRTRRPLRDPMTDLYTMAPAESGTLRVAVGHGQVDRLVPEVDESAPIRLAELEAAVGQGRAHFVALGDRHSSTSVHESGRIWFAGTTEQTRPEEDDPGNVLQVRLTADSCQVTPVRIGRWRLLSHVADVDGDESVQELADWLAGQPDKARTVLRLGVRGTLSVNGFTRLEMLLDSSQELFAAIQRWDRHWQLGLRPDDDELQLLDLGGPARGALEELRAASGTGDEIAAEALVLLHRLATGT